MRFRLTGVRETVLNAAPSAPHIGIGPVDIVFHRRRRAHRRHRSTNVRAEDTRLKLYITRRTRCTAKSTEPYKHVQMPDGDRKLARIHFADDLRMAFMKLLRRIRKFD